MKKLMILSIAVLSTVVTYAGVPSILTAKIDIDGAEQVFVKNFKNEVNSKLEYEKDGVRLKFDAECVAARSSEADFHLRAFLLNNATGEYDLVAESDEPVTVSYGQSVKANIKGLDVVLDATR